MPQLKPYPKYKPSGIQWIGDVPEHWNVTRLKYLATINDEVLPDTTEPSLELHYVDIGSVHPTNGITEIQKFDFENAPSRARRIVRRGDVIVSTVRTYLRAIAPIKIDDPNLIVSTGFAVIRPKQLDEGFAAYALQAQHFVERVVANSVGVSYPAINATEMAGFPIPHPSLPQQRAIADYLDHQTQIMDSLITKKKRMVELLAERRQSLITHAVTKGLDSQAPTRDSGIEWIGEIPEHWEVNRLRPYLILNDGGVWGDQFDPRGTIILRSTEQTVNGNWDISNPARILLSDSQLNSALLRAGDLVMTKSSGSESHIGKTSLVNREIADMNCCFSNFMQRLRTSKALDPTLLWYLFNSPIGRYQLIFHSTTSTGLGNLNGRIINQCIFPVPPPSEQRAIADYLDHQTQIMDTLTEKLNRQIELLAERRQSLITHAVTGKIDVKESKL